MKVTRSVSTRIAHYLFLIIIFAGTITALSMGIIATNKSDAELINVSGSLRMQSYRLLYTMEYEPEKIRLGLYQYRLSLHAPPLSDLNKQFFTPQEVKQAYHDLIQRWRDMEGYASHHNLDAYRHNIADYVGQLDKFVYLLQRFAEQKLLLAVLIILISMLLIVGMVSYVIWYTKKQVVNPLLSLAKASTQVQMGQFNHIPLDTDKNDELGHLAKVFTQMSSELQRVYAGLESKVNEKTQKLNQTNRSLAMLYHCSQQLTVSDIDRNKLQQVLQQVMNSEYLRALELIICGAEHWNIHLGRSVDEHQWQQIDVTVDEQKLGLLRWQAGLPCPDPRSMDNIAHMLGRTLYFNQTQRQQQQLLLMEERSIIARELHDSLAQVLSFLQIQLTLLKHNLQNDDDNAKHKSLSIIKDFERALRDGYTQLRELLATFRLTVQEANLKLALEQVVESLRNQTAIQMSVNCSLPSQTFNPQQLVHALQIVREAVLNAIKHSQGSRIEIIAHTNEDGENELVVQDNGIGIPSLEEPDGHYGLNIMQERSLQLNAKLSITNRPQGGTEVKITLPTLLH